MSFVIGQSDYFGFGFTTLNGKSLYPRKLSINLLQKINGIGEVVVVAFLLM